MASLTKGGELENNNEHTNVCKKPDPLATLFHQYRIRKKQARAEGRELRTPFLRMPVTGMRDALTLAGLEDGDVLVDVGSGEGTVLLMGARTCNCRAVGIEYDPELVRTSRANAVAAGFTNDGRVSVLEADFFEKDAQAILQSATVIMMFHPKQSFGGQLFPYLLQQAQPGTRIVSYAFDMGAAASAEASCETAGFRFHDNKLATKKATIWLWRVPE